MIDRRDLKGFLGRAWEGKGSEGGMEGRAFQDKGQVLKALW